MITNEEAIELIKPLVNDGRGTALSIIHSIKVIIDSIPVSNQDKMIQERKNKIESLKKKK